MKPLKQTNDAPYFEIFCSTKVALAYWNTLLQSEVTANIFKIFVEVII